MEAVIVVRASGGPSRPDDEGSPATRPATRPGTPDPLASISGDDLVPASYVADLVASRPRGGKRRAETNRSRGRSAGLVPRLLHATTRAFTGRTPSSRQAGRRAQVGSLSGVLVDATDAAAHLAMASTYWDATQILAHSEVADLAMSEALADVETDRAALAAARRSLSHRVSHAHEDRQALATLDQRLDTLRRARALLDEAHTRRFLVGD